MNCVSLDGKLQVSVVLTTGKTQALQSHSVDLDGLSAAVCGTAGRDELTFCLPHFMPHRGAVSTESRGKSLRDKKHPVLWPDPQLNNVGWGELPLSKEILSLMVEMP